MSLPRLAFESVKELAGGGVRLRQVGPSDAAAIQEISFYDGVAAQDMGQTLKVLALIDQDRARGESLHWGISLGDSLEVVGTCGFYRGFPDGVGEVGYVLRSEFRGRGIMTAALRLVVAYGLEELGLAGIVAYTDPHNEASVAVLRRVGFTEVSPAGGDGGEDRKFTLGRALTT